MSTSSSSSTQNHHHHHHQFPAATSAPPPTPNFISTSDSPSTDLLSRLLHRLPPSLSTTTTPSLLRRRSSLTTTTSPPVIPLPNLTTTLTTSLPSVSQLGYFQLTNHPISPHLAHSAESDSLSILNLSREKKQKLFSQPWPLGFDEEDTDVTESVFLDSACVTGLCDELNLSSLREFSCEMEKVGLTVVEALTCALGLRNPGMDDPGSVCSLMCVSDGSVESGKFYPYVVGLHYQFGNKSCSLLTDSCSVSVLAQMDSILVTVGDIAQVWSNGKLKKVRGQPTFSIEEGSDSSSLSMSLLMALPLESTVSPLLPRALISNHGDTDHKENENQDGHDETREESVFNSFLFEDYAWTVYHERVPLKDPLDRYRTSNSI